MRDTGAYGQRFAERYRLGDVASFVTRTLRPAELAVTEVRDDNPAHRMIAPEPREDAFLAGMQLRDHPRHEIWVRPVARTPLGVRCNSRRVNLLRVGS